MNFKSPYILDSNGIKTPADFKINEENGSYSFSFSVSNKAKIKETVLFSSEHGFAPNTAFYGDGYQKLTQYRGTFGSFDAFTGYSDKGHYKMPQTNGYETVYNYALIGSGKNTVLIGAASCNRFRTEIRVNSTQMQIVQCLENLELNAGEEIALEDMVILKGERNEILEKFAQIISKNHPVKKYCEMPVGWCSWYCIGPDISEKDIFDNLKVIKEKAPELKYIQIDDGFQPFMGDWLETSDKFDRPMKDICNDIRKAGFEPAIWLAPFIASQKSRLLKEHPDYFVKDENGNPLCCEGVTFRGWRDAPWYMLDGTNPDTQRFIYDTVREIYNNWGVKYYKLDANVWGALPFGNRYDKNATAVEAYRRGMEAFWKATGDNAFILGCNAPMWPSLGLVTGMRVTNDVVRNVGHMANLSEQCFSRNWMHKKLWINDPDCLIMTGANAKIMDPAGIRSKSPSKKKFYKLNNIYIRASGGMVLSGDYVSKYSNAEIDRLHRILDTDYEPAQFDDALEIGKKETKNGTEYFIFNRSNHFKKYEIPVPQGCSAIDLFNNRQIKIKNGQINFYLTKYDCAWILIKR
ncbi:MAG: glycoside hydrolase family 36 protein [Eubacterium sp.]